jgi:hypothetical protein
MPRKPFAGPGLHVEGDAAGAAGVQEQVSAPAFGVTESGTFCKEDWKVKSTGIQQTPAGTGPVSTLQMSDLQVEGETLAAGASGSVRRALHVPTGRMMSVSLSVSLSVSRSLSLARARALSLPRSDTLCTCRQGE